MKTKKRIVGLLLLAAFISIMGFNEPAFALSKISPKKLFGFLERIPPAWSQKLHVSKRFKLVLDDEAVLDKETGLVWELSPSTDDMDWHDAIAHCYNKNVGGRKGWRLPTAEELASLVSTPAGSDGLTLPEDHPFQNVQSGFYWSATTNTVFTSDAWLVRFLDGIVINDDVKSFKDDSNYVWCVRGAHGYDGGPD
jgi:hypothetical protein